MHFVPGPLLTPSMPEDVPAGTQKPLLLGHLEIQPKQGRTLIQPTRRVMVRNMVSEVVERIGLDPVSLQILLHQLAYLDHVVE
jgi:hypothetical protein